MFSDVLYYRETILYHGRLIMNIQNTNHNIGKRVSDLRKSKKMTQSELADMINITSKHMSEIERGVTGMSIDVQILLSEKLECSIDYLLKGEDYKSVDYLLPDTIVSILNSDNSDELSLLQEYLSFYEKLHCI